MGRFILRALLVLAVLAVASQFLVPPLVEHDLAGHLTEGGGDADVSLSAFPAVRLLFGHGDRIDVRGRSLHLPTSSEEAATLNRLDNFDHVDISLHNSRIGPLTLRNLALRRDGSFPYRVRGTGHTSIAALADAGAQRLGLLQGLALRLGTRTTLGGAARRPIPLHLDMSLTDQGDRLVVLSGSGSVAGVKTGPLAELVTSAVAVRL